MVLMFQGAISYSCAHWQKMPSGARRRFTSRKYSRVNRFDTPVSQGFDGSLTMTSNLSFRWVRKLRPSPTRAVTCGFCSGRWLSFSKKRDAR